MLGPVAQAAPCGCARPRDEVNKANAALAVMGFVADAVDVSEMTGAGLSYMRLAFKEATKAVTGQLKSLPGRMWDLVKRREFKQIGEYAHGTCKLVRVGGKDLAEKVFREEADELAANRFFKAYSAADDVVLAEKLASWHRIYGDPDAVRSAIRALADLKNASGELIRLSDEAVEGAVKFAEKAGTDVPAAERERLLRRILESPPDEAGAFLEALGGVGIGGEGGAARVAVGPGGLRPAWGWSDRRRRRRSLRRKSSKTGPLGPAAGARIGDVVMRSRP